MYCNMNFRTTMLSLSLRIGIGIPLILKFALWTRWIPLCRHTLTMASSMINTFFGKDASAYFATFGFIAASYLAFKIALNLIKVLKSVVFAGSTNFRKLGSWAGRLHQTSRNLAPYFTVRALRRVCIIMIKWKIRA